MRNQLTGGAAALLTLLALASIPSLGKISQHNLTNHNNTFAAVTSAALPGVDSYNSMQGDYLNAVCGQGVYQWQPSKMPIKVYVADGTGTPGYRPQFRDYVRNAFNTWCQASGAKLSWKEVNSPSNADIKIGWTNQVTQRSTGTECGETNAYTQLNRATNRGIIYGAHMSLLTQLPNKQFSDDFMDKTILHETGHALGLQGHSPNRTDIMYYAINDDQACALTSRDAATMADLYADYPNNVAMK